MTEWLLLACAVVLTAGTALCVTTEFSLVALDRSTVQRAIDDGDHRARSVLISLRGLSTQLSAAQVGITVTTLIVGYLAEPSAGTLLEAPFEALGLAPEAAAGIATGLAFVAVTALSMVFGELAPQFIGISAPLAAAKVVATPVRIFSIVVRPLIAVLNGSANRVLRWMGITPQEELSAARAPKELASLVRHSAERGTLEEGLARRVTRSLGFGDQTAGDVMTPRVRATAVPRRMDAAQVIDLARQTGFSRFPVTDRGWDGVVGMVHVKQAIAVPQDRRTSVDAEELMTAPVLVPETMGLDSLLVRLRTAPLQMAIVVDEYGGTSGVVTLEDVVEEIVGEVSDEHDPAGDRGRLRPDGRWSLPGLLRPDEVRDQLGAPVPDDHDYETLGGFMMSCLHRIPRTGDEVRIPGWVLSVARMDGMRVDRVLFTAVDDPSAHPREVRTGEGP